MEPPAPSQGTFIGRERELAEVHELLRAHRLVTLTGAGGSGKTRLALELAGSACADFPDGAWLVDLAPVGDRDLVVQTVAGVFGLRELAGHQLVDIVAEHLAGRRGLLLLDNCEHLREPCAVLADQLLAACPELRILATSREPLRSPFERVWMVPTLSLPATGERRVREAVEWSESERLFVDRASSRSAAFNALPEIMPAVGEVCRRLDGIPLAIELAAARTNVLTPEQIARNLDEALRLLSRGQGPLARHQTLQASFDWSYELLEPKQRALLRRLSVFMGGWGLDAAERVGSGGEVAPEDVLDLLSELIDKSLVRAERVGQRMRYSMLETLRQYAGQQLEVEGELEATRQRHLDWCLELARRFADAWRHMDDTRWLGRIAREHANLRAALHWARRPRNRPLGLGLVASLWWFWAMHGYMAEGRRYLGEFLAADAQDGSARQRSDRAQALAGLAMLASYQPDFPAAQEAAREGLALDQREASPVCLTALGFASLFSGDPGAARQHLRQAIEASRAAGLAYAESIALNMLGNIARMEGEYDLALECHQTALDISQLSGHQLSTALGYEQLGRVRVRQGDLERAEVDFSNSLELRRQVGSATFVVWAIENFVWLAAAQGQAERAVRLAGAAAALRRQTGAALPPPEQAELDEWLALARGSLSLLEAGRAWASGQAMSLDEAADYALQGQPPAEPAAFNETCPLSRRERQIVALLARGLSNKEIAGELVLSPRTVERHIANVYDKTGLHGRAAMTAYAIKAGLLSETA